MIFLLMVHSQMSTVRSYEFFSSIFGSEKSFIKIPSGESMDTDQLLEEQEIINDR